MHIQLPQSLYEAIRKEALAQKKTADALIAEWASERLATQKINDIASSFEREVAAFEKMRPLLLQEYADKYVAIYQEKVIASGDEKLPLLHKVREELGNVICYIEKVTSDSPRTVRMPSAQIARQ
ncbi:MAG: hypothetical protein KC421_29300 [Anaerolineales bacterium]|nr:hypothetical protein [Anaerolineales bacterium]